MAKSALGLADLVNFACGRFSKNVSNSLRFLILAPFVFMFGRDSWGGDVAERFEVVVIDVV